MHTGLIDSSKTLLLSLIGCLSTEHSGKVEEVDFSPRFPVSLQIQMYFINHKGKLDIILVLH